MLSQELVKKGHEITVITTTRGKLDKKRTYIEWMNGIKVIRYPETRYLLEAPLVPQIGFRVFQENYDLLHVHGMTPSISDIAIIFGKLKRKPVVLTYHYDPETPLFGFLGVVAARIYARIAYFLLNMVDQIVATTRSYAETSPVLSRLLKKVEIIPLGVDKTKFNMPKDHEGLRNNYTKIDDKCSVILFVGQLREHKGLRYLLKAIRIVKAKTSNVHLIIVGDGPKRVSLVNYASKLNVSDAVSFVGNVSEDVLPQYYAISNVVVLPSYTRRDAFGLVLLEAMAAGKPIIASDIPGVQEVAKGVGILVPPKFPEKLAEAILKILSCNQFSEELEQNARKNIQLYTWEHVAERYEQIYKKVLLH